MFYDKNIRRNKKKFGRRFLINEKLANYSWFNLGGPAEFFFKPENINDLIDFLKEVRPNALKVFIIYYINLIF